MKQIRSLAASLFLLFLCAVPVSAYEPENAGWAPAYEQYILNGEYLTSAEPSYYTEDADPIRFGLYDLDKDGFPELVAYNGCPFMAGACNYLFTYKNGQFSYIGDAGFDELHDSLRIGELKNALDFDDERSEKYEFFDRDATLTAVRAAFERRRGRNSRLAVAFITEDGTRQGEVLAMLTSWDVLKDVQ